MVFFFDIEGYTVYMGRDKFENEDLIRWGWLEDVWFHVDSLSSAHVYLRLNTGQKYRDVPPSVIESCAKLVKENSIEGKKLPEVRVCYTRWANLLKTRSHEVGAVSFHDQSKVRYITVQKDRPTTNAIERTRREEYPDLEQERRDKEREYKAMRKAAKQRAEREERQARQEAEERRKLESYESLFAGAGAEEEAEGGVGGATSVEDYEDGFM